MPTKRQKKPVKRTVSKTTKKRPVFQVSASLSDQKPLMSTVVEVESSPEPIPTMSVVPEEEVSPTLVSDDTTSDEIETSLPPPPAHIDQVETPESVVVEAPPDEQIEPIVERVDKKSKFILFFGLGFLLGIVAASVVLYFYTKTQSNVVNLEPTANVIPSPSPSPEPVLNKKYWVWQVQNGSGVAGAAKVAADKLEELGFEVESTTNAANTDYEGYSVYLESKEASDSALLLKILSTDFEDATLSGTFTPANDSTSTARLIIGR